MRDGLVRDRIAEERSAEGVVDKSVVNWLMQVISGKDPLALGINEAAAEQPGAAEPRPQIVVPREEVIEPAVPAANVIVGAQDLRRAPAETAGGEAKTVYQALHTGTTGMVSKETKVERGAESQFEAAQPESEGSEAEKSEPGRFKRMFGLKLVGGKKQAETEDSRESQLPGAGLLREGASYGPLSTESSRAIANGPRSDSWATGGKAEGFDPLDLVRDPDYYEEKMQARTKIAHQEVDFIPSETEPVYEASSAAEAPVIEEEVEAELVQMIHEAPVTAEIPDPFAGIDFSTAPPVVEIPDPFAGIDFSIAPAAPAIPDPFAGIDFSAGPAIEVEAVEPIVSAPRLMVAAAEPFAAVAGSQIEPKVVAMMPKAVEEAAKPEAVEIAPAVEAIAPIPEPAAATAPIAVEAATKAEELPAVGVAVEVAASAPAAELEPEMIAEPEFEGTAAARPEVAEEEVLATPGVFGEMEGSIVAVPAAESGVKPEAAASAVDAELAASEIPWTVAEAQRNPSDVTFSAQEYYQQELPKREPAKVAAQSAPAAQAPTVSLGKEGEAKAEDLSAAIKTLMQLGAVLPLAARMSPAREGDGEGVRSDGGSQEVKQEVSGLRLLQYEIKTTVQDHSMHLKRLEDQLMRMRESAEMDSAESASVMDNVKSTAKMVRVMGISLGVMLLALILMIGMILSHVR